MFTPKQNDELCRIISERPRSIRDLALLSLAYTQNHAMLMEWRQVAPRPVRFRCFDNFEPRPLNMLEKMPFFIEPIQHEKSFLWHVGDCYYIGLGNGPGSYTTSLRTLLKMATDVESLCTECLGQVSRVLRHLYDKDIGYVHGNLTVDSVVQSTDGRFYIVDDGIHKRNTAANPFACYTSVTHDMTTLCQSMRAAVRPETFVGLLHETVETGYESFVKHVTDHLKVFKSNIQKDT